MEDNYTETDYSEYDESDFGSEEILGFNETEHGEDPDGNIYRMDVDQRGP